MSLVRDPDIYVNNKKGKFRKSVRDTIVSPNSFPKHSAQKPFLVGDGLVEFSRFD